MTGAYSSIQELVVKALPGEAVVVVCVGQQLHEITDDLGRIVGRQEAIESITLDGQEDHLTLAHPDMSVHAIVLHRALGLLKEEQLSALLHECQRVLVDGGRIVIRDRVLPYSRFTPVLRLWLRRAGVRYTPAELFTLLERAGFWDCLVLRAGGAATDVVVKGEKVVQQAELDGPDTPQDKPVVSVFRQGS